MPNVVIFRLRALMAPLKEGFRGGIPVGVKGYDAGNGQSHHLVSAFNDPFCNYIAIAIHFDTFNEGSLGYSDAFSNL